jgi:hypothetical protein
VGEISADDTTDDATDLAMVVNLTTDATSTVMFAEIDNELGTIEVTLTGSGDFNLGTTTPAVALFAASTTVDATAATGTNVINVSTSTAATVNLAVNEGTDTVVLSANAVTITNFQAGTSGDVIGLDETALGAIIGGDGADDVDSVAVLILEATATDTIAAGENVLVLSGAIFATAALAEAAIENNGSHEVILAGANEANDDLVVVWSDGSSSFVGTYNITTTATTDLEGALTQLIEITGVDASVAGTLVSANFDLL